VGDTVCATNPTFGRGLALALQGATDLAELLEEYGEDEMGLDQALENFVTRHVEPFYLDQAANDGRRLAELRHTLVGAPAPETTPPEDRVTFTALRAAMPFDAIVFRAFWRVMGMLAKPDDVCTHPDVVAPHSGRAALPRHRTHDDSTHPRRATSRPRLRNSLSPRAALTYLRPRR
jgi:hypothetical protein